MISPKKESAFDCRAFGGAIKPGLPLSVRGTLIDVQKIRLTHVVAAARTQRATPNIIPTNDFRRCVKRSHCSIAEVRRWAGNAPLGRNHFRRREWQQSVFVNTNYHALVRARLLYWIIGKFLPKANLQNFIRVTRFIERDNRCPPERPCNSVPESYISDV